MGEKQNQPFHLLFDASLKVDFQGSRVTSNGGLILVRELDERLGLEKLIEEHLSDSRQGLNKQFTLADLPDITGCCWQKVTSRGGCLGACCAGSRRCRCHRVSTPIVVTKSGAEGGRSAQCLRNRLRGNKRGASDRQRTSRRHAEASLGAAVVIKFLSLGTKES